MKKILCAAILFKTGRHHSHCPKNIGDGFVVCGRRHANAIATATMIDDIDIDAGIQGFLTTDDEFVTREDALVIAKEAGQMIRNTNPTKLYSEDLY